jgi:hypothetical protein
MSIDVGLLGCLRKGKDMKTAIMIVIILVLGFSPLYSVADEPPPMPSQEQPEVLTSGPVHEAFAEPVNLQVQGGLVAPIEPPANIIESPPAERPEGSQYVWVPGYWAWDNDRQNYIWVSACWRAAPPNMYWVPGYWSHVANGWEWVAGFWTPVSVQEIQYLPAPPMIVDVPPPGPPPSIDVVWVPPCNYWYAGHYVLRAGYWLHQQPGWVWVPSHHLWTPRGYVFVEGHWDFALERRGVLFAPVYFPRSVYLRPRFVYSPSIVIDIGTLQVNLFAYPRYCHYYFGDYYDNVYLSIGIYPWFECERRHIWYDPFFSYARWHHRDEPRWEEHERHEYDIRRADRSLRPARTYHEMEMREDRMPEQQRGSIRMARPMNDVVASKATMRFEQLDTKTQKKITSQTTEVSKFRDKRSRLESPAIGQKSTQQITERKGTVTPPAEHKQPLQPVTQQRKDTVTPPTERKQPMPQVTEQRKDTVTPPTERKGPAAPATEQRKDSVTPSSEQNPVFVSPREVRATKAEKVKIGKSPIVSKSVDSGKSKVGQPPNPAEEHQQVGNTSDKDKGRDKNKAK